MTRLPLKVGTSSLTSLARGAAAFVPASILLAVASAIALVLVAHFGELGGYVAALLVVVALTGFNYARRHLRHAWDSRPTDVVIDREGFRIVGGHRDGAGLAWDDIDDCRVEPTPGEDAVVAKLYVSAKGHRWLMATADHDVSERKALEDVAATIRAGAANARRGAPRTTGTEQVTCGACGGVVPPDSHAEVTCPFCDARVPMPTAVRARVLDAGEIAIRPNRRIARLLAQPSARVLTFYFAFAAAFMLLAWPAAIFLFTRAVLEHTASVTTGVTTLAFVASTVLGFYALLRGRLVARVAVRLLLEALAANAPASEGDPFGCRACGGPLPGAGLDRAVVACPHCRRENVLVRDLHREADAARAERQSIDEALAYRERQRIRLRGVGAVALVLLADAGLTFRTAFAENPISAPLQRRCDAGDLDACVELGERHLVGDAKGVRRSPRGSKALFERACSGGSAHGCAALADFHATRAFRDDGADATLAPALRERACNGGWAPACAALAETYARGYDTDHVKRDDAKAHALFERACDGGVTSACAR